MKSKKDQKYSLMRPREINPPKKKKGNTFPVSIDKPLTPQQQKFVLELTSNDGFITKTEAALRAGMSLNSARTYASRLTSPDYYPNVVAAIEATKADLIEKHGVTFERHVRDLKEIRDQALQNGAYSAAVQAEYRRGQAHGDIYVTKSEIRHGTIDSMSKEEVMKALEDLRNTYEGKIIDVTPTEQPPVVEPEETRGVSLDATEDSPKQVIEEEETTDNSD